MTGEGPYRAEDYWSDRLARDFTLRGTGHIAYSESYNRWLYRAKRRALRRALGNTGGLSPALDLGSGTGWVVGELLGLGIEVRGTDLTDLSVARLRERFPGVEFDQVDVGAERFPAEDDGAALVTAFDVLYHVVDDAGWRHAIAEVSRVLKPGGRFVVTDGFGVDEVQPARHVRLRNREMWERVAAEAGLWLEATIPLYRWLSRERSGGMLRKLPDGVRGPVEYSLERLAPGRPHMICAVFARDDISRVD